MGYLFEYKLFLNLPEYPPVPKDIFMPLNFQLHVVCFSLKIIWLERRMAQETG